MSSSSVPSAKSLKTALKAIGENLNEHSRTRLHRAISWLHRAEQEHDDPDAQFVFQWIAFNAAYAHEFDEDSSERRRLQEFLAKLVELDTQRRLHTHVMERYSGAIRTLIDNKFVFEPFWKALRTHDASGEWERQFAAAKQKSMLSLMHNRTDVVLATVFDRLYVLRNQLVHGGATWNSRVNRQQVKDAANLLSTLNPIVIDVMLEHPEHDFGEVMYPVV